MRTLIAYASKSGTAQEAAEHLGTLIPDSHVVNLEARTPALQDYEAVIVGGGVRMGSVHKLVKRFIDSNVEDLGNLKTAFFITNCFADSAEEILQKMVPVFLREQALWAGSVGGRLDVDNLKGMDRVVAKAVSKAEADSQRISKSLDDEALNQLADCFR